LSLRVALAFCTLGAAIGLPRPAQGQLQRSRVVAEADSAYEAGNIPLADSLYYIAVRYWPRDPLARTALGRYLGAHGRTKPAIVLLEEARMFGGDPVAIGRHLAPLYEQLGEWRGLLTLPGSPLSIAERRRAAWLSEHPFGVESAGGPATIIGMPRGDTIARVGARVNGKPVVAAMLATDDGMVVGTRFAENLARRFEGDPTIVLFDSVSIGQSRLVNVPASVGLDEASLSLGIASLGRRIIQIDYARGRLVLASDAQTRPQVALPLSRRDGRLRVLNRGRWMSLADFAGEVARSRKTLIVDIAAGEVRVRP
jgi:hypothetical protein